MKKPVLKTLIIMICILSACSAPSSTESFVRSGDRTDGKYVFSADMSDSSAVYAMAFYTRIDCSRAEFAGLKDIRADIVFVSPSGDRYGETVFFPKSAFRTSDSLTWNFSEKYREGIRPIECGLWRVEVNIPEDDDIRGFRGLGLVLEKRKK